MAKKPGVYVCKGCGIGECLDIQKLVDIATTEFRAPVVRTSPAFCLEDARLIKDDVEQEGVDAVVIAAGGHSKADTTRGDQIVAFALPPPR